MSENNTARQVCSVHPHTGTVCFRGYSVQFISKFRFASKHNPPITSVEGGWDDQSWEDGVRSLCTEHVTCVPVKSQEVVSTCAKWT